MAFSPLNGSFTIINDNPGLNVGDTDHVHGVFCVRDGRIQDAPSDLRNYVGMRLDAFLDDLCSATDSRDMRVIVEFPPHGAHYGSQVKRERAVGGEAQGIKRKLAAPCP